ncbi:MAG: regulatory protein RecX [Bacteroidaceae bacterium]
MPKIKQPLSEEEIYQRLSRRCAMCEYAPHDIRQKALQLGATHDVADRLIDRLISENFINEQRYARSFTHDKFTFSHWGKTKISVSLKQKGISNEAINNALATIDPNQYRETLKNILAQKSRQLNEENPFMRQRKLASHAIGKGFEPEQVISAIDQL